MNVDIGDVLEVKDWEPIDGWDLSKYVIVLNISEGLYHLLFISPLSLRFRTEDIVFMNSILESKWEKV